MLSPRAEAHLDLERVPVRANVIEVDGREHLPAKALEPSGRVPELEARDAPSVDVRAVAQHQSRDGPVHHRHAPMLVPRTDHEVGVRGRREKLRQVNRVMGEVRVHLEDERVVAFECPPEAGKVGRAQPHLAGAVQHVHPGVGGNHCIDNGPGAIRRAVVHDEDLQPAVLGQRSLDQSLDVFPLVVRRDDDECLLSHAPSAPRRRPARVR